MLDHVPRVHLHKYQATEQQIYNSDGYMKQLSAGNKHVRRVEFTLIEVMLVMAFTGVALTAALGLITATMWGEKYIRHRYTAHTIASNRIEQLRSFPYSELTAMEESATPVDEQGTLNANGDYRRTTVVGSEFRKTRQVTVTVSSTWKEGLPAQSVAMVTIIADHAVMGP